MSTQHFPDMAIGTVSTAQDDQESPETEELYERCVQMTLATGKANSSILQRNFRIGYGRAALLLDMMERRGIVANISENFVKKYKVVAQIPRFINLDDEQLSEEDAELYSRCVVLVVALQKAGTSLLQRSFNISYGRAAKMMDLMEQHGVISTASASRTRKVLIPALL